MTDHPDHEAGERDAARWRDALHAQGKRVTKQRLAVLAAAHDLPHATAEALTARVREQLPDITAQSVYIVLTDLTDGGLLRKLHTPGNPARYETRVGDNHHHIMCVDCGRVSDVACVVGHAPCLTPDEDGGMRLLAADVLFQGLCADCQAIREREGRPLDLAPERGPAAPARG
ncbi:MULTISPECIES: Fur family transcriptional regulator [unclassified Pseudactinotalea]|uniref:Fur family transcriptional regulator n=1 Tax=unclassified Pseudactinotalea TaxID=2649176 RepID=UPI00128C257A|nr:MULTISPECIES: Fur family transcriptional regulator [unclassified Pseudactinotalea]MPV50831.1 transcriptional repressor [Pseudactinotalea sp. HY160]QGH70827.1 transcriptional repressor [Pseudactinotalea sp. HY158]